MWYRYDVWHSFKRRWQSKGCCVFFWYFQMIIISIIFKLRWIGLGYSWVGEINPQLLVDSMWENTHNPILAFEKMEAGGSESQYNPRLYSEFEESLGYHETSQKYRYSSHFNICSNFEIIEYVNIPKVITEPEFQNYYNMLTTIYPKRCCDSFEKYSDHPFDSSEFMGKGNRLCIDSRSTVHLDLTCQLSISGGWHKHSHLTSPRVLLGNGMISVDIHTLAFFKKDWFQNGISIPKMT